MTFTGLSTRVAAFSARAVSPHPEAPYSIEQPPVTAGDAEALSSQHDLVEEAPPPNPPPPLTADPTATVSSPGLVYLSELQLRPVEWLWQDRLASGTLAMISGVPGSGKTWVALAIAAALTRGRTPFTGEKFEPSTVLYASTEHDSSEVIHPRFARLNGDAARFVVLRGALSTPAVLPSLLEDALQRTHARLVILDPFHNLLDPGVHLHRTKATRPLLATLASLAEKHRCCILLIRHLEGRGPGRPANRGDGSAEISAALRTEFLAGTSPDAPSKPALLQVKSNLGPLALPLAYKIDEDGNFLWTGPSTLTLEDVLASRPTGAGRPERRFVGEWLRQSLQDGCKTQGALETDACRDGIRVATLRRAKFDLGVRSVKDGAYGPWYWALPPLEEPQPAVEDPRCSN